MKRRVIKHTPPDFPSPSAPMETGIIVASAAAATASMSFLRLRFRAELWPSTGGITIMHSALACADGTDERRDGIVGFAAIYYCTFCAFTNGTRPIATSSSLFVFFRRGKTAVAAAASTSAVTASPECWKHRPSRLGLRASTLTAPLSPLHSLWVEGVHLVPLAVGGGSQQPPPPSRSGRTLPCPPPPPVPPTASPVISATPTTPTTPGSVPTEGLAPTSALVVSPAASTWTEVGAELSWSMTITSGEVGPVSGSGGGCDGDGDGGGNRGGGCTAGRGMAPSKYGQHSTSMCRCSSWKSERRVLGARIGVA